VFVIHVEFVGSFGPRRLFYNPAFLISDSFLQSIDVKLIEVRQVEIKLDVLGQGVSVLRNILIEELPPLPHILMESFSVGV
jgi:hypothetical protein